MDALTAHRNGRRQQSTGNDTLDGGSGDDYYTVGQGDTDIDSGGKAGKTEPSDINVDEAYFEASYNVLWFKQLGSDLEVSVVGAADKVTVQGWFTSPDNQVETFYDDNGVTGGHTLHAQQVGALVTAMAQFTPQDMSLPGTPAVVGVYARRKSATPLLLKARDGSPDAQSTALCACPSARANSRSPAFLSCCRPLPPV